MRRSAPRFIPLALPLLCAVAGCGDHYQPEQLYMATTPDCREWVDGSTFKLPEGVTVSATTPATPKPGSAELGIVYLVPRGGRVQFVTRAFDITQPKGATIARAKVLSYYQRGTNGRAEMVEVIENAPGLLLPVATADTTQWRIRLGVDGALPERFDLVMSDVIIANERYPVRTFTYRWFAQRKAYGLCR